jgi:hypothetical protein
MNLKINNYVNSPYFKVKNFVLNNYPNYFDKLEDSLSDGQFESKTWLIEKLNISYDFLYPVHVEIIGGWFGFPLIEMLDYVIDIESLDFYELDEINKKILVQYTNYFNLNFKVKVFDDYFERKELRRRHLIVNTSSEHMEDVVRMKPYYKDYPEPPILVLQSNNYYDLVEHVNCVNSAEELIEKNSIKKVFYSGSKKMDNYTRFMVIGQW